MGGGLAQAVQGRVASERIADCGGIGELQQLQLSHGDLQNIRDFCNSIPASTPVYFTASSTSLATYTCSASLDPVRGVLGGRSLLLSSWLSRRHQDNLRSMLGAALADDILPNNSSVASYPLVLSALTMD